MDEHSIRHPNWWQLLPFDVRAWLKAIGTLILSRTTSYHYSKFMTTTSVWRPLSLNKVHPVTTTTKLWWPPINDDYLPGMTTNYFNSLFTTTISLQQSQSCYNDHPIMKTVYLRWLPTTTTPIQQSLSGYDHHLFMTTNQLRWPPTIAVCLWWPALCSKI